MMTKRVWAVATTLALLGGAAVAQQSSINLLTAVPQNASTMTNYYKQSVYDPTDSKIGDVSDLLIQPDGKIAAAMVGVGGFLGIGEKDVAVPFEAIKTTTKDNKVYLIMNTSKDALKSAPGFKYDRSSATWVPEDSVPSTRMK
jgi:sporulation protein YlmC with PRC-barrel domain